MEYYSAIKKNTFESVLMRWMKLEPIIHVPELAPSDQLFTFPRATPRGRGSGDDTASHGALRPSAAIGPAGRLLFQIEAPSRCSVSWASGGD